ncbi:lysozyme family protein [Tepidamorphus gemmatus]|uniref:Lysozyme family protein n=1 Tax=Tepidamorphus gemmatus TaxID=747076 RepID=A0A4R3M5P1_9HYPH|nr:glycoside hydrolase family 108 protein [Tepidamorphus gemmatus]TCT08691.1 lysozyme family protein [Tepidamorphus gemmatus]
MAAESLAHVLPHLFRHEGGYADHPSDPGGATKYGISRTTLAAWRGGAVAKSDVRALTRAEAAAIYRARYWDAVKADDLPAGIDYAVFDAAVNSGPVRAAKWLQAAVRVPQDGIVGPVTLAAAAAADPVRTIADICAIRLAFLRALSTWPAFGRGWSRRVDEVKAESLAMARRAAMAPAAPPDAPPGLPSRPGEAAGQRRAGGILAFIARLLRALLTGRRA